MSYILRKAVHKYVQCMAAGAASLAFMPGALHAQQIENPEEGKRATLEEIVVTGTLIRGVEAIGSQTTKSTTGSAYFSLGTTDRDIVKNGTRDWAKGGNWAESEDGN